MSNPHKAWRGRKGSRPLPLQEKDPAKAVAGLVEFGPRRYGGEAFFAPGGEDEDDGFLMTYVYDEDGDSSELVVYNARTMADKVGATAAI